MNGFSTNDNYYVITTIIYTLGEKYIKKVVTEHTWIYKTTAVRKLLRHDP